MQNLWSTMKSTGWAKLLIQWELNYFKILVLACLNGWLNIGTWHYWQKGGTHFLGIRNQYNDLFGVKKYTPFYYEVITIFITGKDGTVAIFMGFSDFITPLGRNNYHSIGWKFSLSTVTGVEHNEFTRGTCYR